MRAIAYPRPNMLRCFLIAVQKQQAAQLKRLKAQLQAAKRKAIERKLRERLADAIQAVLKASPAEKPQAKAALGAIQAKLARFVRSASTGKRTRNAFRHLTHAIKSAKANSQKLAARLTKLDAATAKVDALLAAGKITQAQADARKAKINASKTGLQKALTKANVRRRMTTEGGVVRRLTRLCRCSCAAQAGAPEGQRSRRQGQTDDAQGDARSCKGEQGRQALHCQGQGSHRCSRPRPCRHRLGHERCGPQARRGGACQGKTRGARRACPRRPV